MVYVNLSLSVYNTLPTNKQHWLHQRDLERILQQINWLTVGNTDIWVQFDTNSKCHAIFLHVSSLFVTAPAGSAICIQLFGTGYEYSEQFVCMHSKAKPSKSILVNRGICSKMPGGNQLSESSARTEMAHIAHPCRASTKGPVSLREWLAGPQHYHSKAFTMFHICDEKSPPSSSPSSPPPSCSNLICSYGSQPVAS